MGILITLIATLLALSGFIAIFIRHRRKKGDQRLTELTRALQGKQEESKLLIESITDGIVVVDTNCIVSLINRAAAEMTNWSEKDAVGFDARTVLRILKDEKTNQTYADEEHPITLMLRNHQNYKATVQLLNRDNTKVYISISISPILIPRTKDFAGAIAVFRDVSKEREEEAQRAEFISTASHEMRTPVAAIEGYLALAMNTNVSKIDDKARSYLEKAHSSTQHLGKLFQDLLTSAKAEDGRLTSHPDVVEMGSFVEQLAQDLRFSAQKKNLETEFVINTAKDTGVIDASATGGSMRKSIQPLYYSHVDPDRIREVITNVFDNAVKYTEKGKISIGVTGDDKVVQIRVADTGPGIPAEDISHLFQKFYRVDNSATRTVGGTGLGLFICKKIVELYNGHIWAESKVGEGSTFYINLPRISSSQAKQMQMQAKAEPTGVQPSGQ